MINVKREVRMLRELKKPKNLSVLERISVTIPVDTSSIVLL